MLPQCHPELQTPLLSRPQSHPLPSAARGRGTQLCSFQKGPCCSHSRAHIAEADVVWGVTMGNVQKQIIAKLVDELSLLCLSELGQKGRERAASLLPDGEASAPSGPAQGEGWVVGAE